MADGVVITRLDPSTTGTALNLTLSYDDLSTLANFGKSEEVDLQYKKVTAQDGSTLGLIAHYPDYKNSERKDGGYATLTYVLPVGGHPGAGDAGQANQGEPVCWRQYRGAHYRRCRTGAADR